ncbi:MAG: hypothetical protein JO041_13170 [Acidobacteria bacterium]|nr:hypothetical protein [Acidobacteriota bacterium]
MAATSRFSLVCVLGLALAGLAQNGAPSSSVSLLPGANSAAESSAIAYMRTVMRSEFLYRQKHKEFARTLALLVGSGSFTRRMARTDRGDYTVRYSGNGQDYGLSLVPAAYDDQHRAFYVDQDGTIRAQEGRPANAQSPALLPKRK